MINLVENLLSATRIENGTMQLTKHAELLEDIIDEALKHISRKSKEYEIKKELPDEVLLVNVDSRLILQVFINLLDKSNIHRRAERSRSKRKQKRNLSMCGSRTAGSGFQRKRKSIYLICFIWQMKKSWTRGEVSVLGWHCADRSLRHTVGRYGCMIITRKVPCLILHCHWRR